ncbi:MAG TPA: hypothetical protein VF763_11835 [Candidatus Limnocylindrales bacterium]
MQVIVRPPSAAFRSAISTHHERDRIDPLVAAQQHASFCGALEAAGVSLVRLPAEPELPDAPFVSDVVLALPPAAQSDGPTARLLALRPGAQPRRPEVASVVAAARPLVGPDVPVGVVEPPALLEGGDVIVFGDRLAVGVSARTNEAGARLLAAEAAALGYRAFLCPVTDRLHLATAVTAVRADLLIGTAAGFASLDAAGPEVAPAEVRRLVLPDAELAGANVLPLGGTCFVARGNPTAVGLLEAAGERVVEVELGEFVRADGGPTCLVALVP